MELSLFFHFHRNIVDWYDSFYRIYNLELKSKVKILESIFDAVLKYPEAAQDAKTKNESLFRNVHETTKYAVQDLDMVSYMDDETKELIHQTEKYFGKIKYFK